MEQEDQRLENTLDEPISNRKRKNNESHRAKAIQPRDKGAHSVQMFDTVAPSSDNLHSGSPAKKVGVKGSKAWDDPPSIPPSPIREEEGFT